MEALWTQFLMVCLTAAIPVVPVLAAFIIYQLKKLMGAIEANTKLTQAAATITSASAEKHGLNGPAVQEAKREIASSEVKTPSSPCP